MLVAVYGTLRQGQGNNYLLRYSEFLGECSTLPEYEMYDCGCPFVSPGGLSSIRVEVYRINSQTFEYLDMLEGYPILYDRIQIPTPYGEAWMYVVGELREFYNVRHVPGGDWVEYLRTRSRVPFWSQ